MDLCVSFFLLIPKTRRIALVSLLFFHVINQFVFFSIITGDSVGYFPLLGIISMILFVKDNDIIILKKWWVKSLVISTVSRKINQGLSQRWVTVSIVLFLIIQIILPIRRFIMQEDPFLMGESYRYSHLDYIMQKKAKINTENPIFLNKSDTRSLAYFPKEALPKLYPISGEITMDIMINETKLFKLQYTQ